LGIKILRDDVDSANTVAMFGVNGFDSWNFFERDAANHIGAAGGVALTLVAKKFSTATPYIQTVGLSEWAEIDQTGENVKDPKFPYKLVFKATD